MRDISVSLYLSRNAFHLFTYSFMSVSLSRLDDLHMYSYIESLHLSLLIFTVVKAKDKQFINRSTGQSVNQSISQSRNSAARIVITFLDRNCRYHRHHCSGRGKEKEKKRDKGWRGTKRNLYLSHRWFPLPPSRTATLRRGRRSICRRGRRERHIGRGRKADLCAAVDGTRSLCWCTIPDNRTARTTGLRFQSERWRRRWRAFFF